MYRFNSILLTSILIVFSGLRLSIAGDLPNKSYQPLFDMKEGRLPASARTIDEVDDDSGYDVYHYNLEIQFNPSTESVDGHVDMYFTATEDQLQQIAMNLHYQMTIDQLQVDGLDATYSLEYLSDLTVDLNEILNLGDSAVVSIDYHGIPVQSGPLGALFWSQHLGETVVASLSEPEGARSWWPCKDVPWDKATARMVWTVPDNWTATGNGLLESISTPEPGLKSYEWIENYPITTYLIAASATNYSHWTDWYVNTQNDSLPLEYYVYPEDLNNSHIDFVDLPDMIGYYSDAFGDYPFMNEKYGMVAFMFGGAMEHQTLTSMGASWINGYGPTFNDWIYAHELAHMWWGDMVTCGTWMDIWMNEGFATYSDALWHRFNEGQQAFLDRMEDFYDEYIGDDPSQGRFPIYDPVEMWGSTVYEKGSWILHMIHYVLGEEDFFDWLASYRNQYEFSAATSTDLQQTLEDYTGNDWDWFFNEWIYMAGYPEYEWGWNMISYGDSSLVQIMLNQVQSTANQTPEVFEMPIEFGVTTAGSDTVVTVQNNMRNQYFDFMIYNQVSNIEFDPGYWVLCVADQVPYVGIGDTPKPETYELALTVHPNPANPEAQITFTLPNHANARLSIYNLLGQEIATLWDGMTPQGETRVNWNGSRVASGVYLVKLESTSGVKVRKLAVLK